MPDREPNSVRVITPMPSSLVARLDAVRFAERHPSRADLVRQLLDEALQARAASTAKVPR